jgi:predicted PurR-regulated permease PerM
VHVTPDRIASFFEEKTAKRALQLATFLFFLVLFRKLSVILVCFVIFERALYFTAGALVRKRKWNKTVAFALVCSIALICAGVATYFSAGRVAELIVDTKNTLPEKIESIKRNDLFIELQKHLPDSDDLVEKMKHYSSDALAQAAAFGHLLIYALIGLILALVFYFEEPNLRAFKESIDSKSLLGTLLRWFEYLAEAVSLTVQIQLVVAAVNTVLTLPVLFVIGAPNIPALMLLIFVCGLIPVAGNVISGAVLSLIAFQTKGIFGVGLFIGLTFVLHKIESYFLNPRLTARHIKLPGFILILSLIAFEHLLGFVGLFVSFPFLFVTQKLFREFQEENVPKIQPVTPET